MLKDKFKEIQALLLSGLKFFYGDRLVSVVLFGSVARETQTFDSDIDLLIIATKLPRGRTKRMKEFESVEKKVEPLLETLRKEYGIHTYISPIIKTPEEAERGSPLFLDMVEDAKILFDRDRFFEKRLERLRQKLKELGARRIWRGNAWYWDLKPDYQPGDIIEL